MKRFSILSLMASLSLIAAAWEKSYPLVQEKDVEISKYNSAFSTSISSVQDPESGRDVLRITYAVKPGTRKNVNLNLSFPALQADQWQAISKISVKLRGGLGHCNVLLIDRDGETFAPKGIRMIGNSAWKNYDFYFNKLNSSMLGFVKSFCGISDFFLKILPFQSKFPLTHALMSCKAIYF